MESHPSLQIPLHVSHIRGDLHLVKLLEYFEACPNYIALIIKTRDPVHWIYIVITELEPCFTEFMENITPQGEAAAGAVVEEKLSREGHRIQGRPDTLLLAAGAGPEGPCHRQRGWEEELGVDPVFNP